MTKWRDALLGDVVTLQRGFDLTERHAGAGDVPVISSSGTSYTTDVPKVSGPGVVTGRKGLLGKVHWSEGPFWPHDTTLWVKDFKGASPRFVYYLLKTLPLAELDAGAANPTLNRNHAHLLPVRIPDAETQRLIANVLDSFDELIDNNRRRVAVLEEIARTIYREWFVKFRYPGHQDTPLVDSPYGRIPEGWTASTCGEELNFIGGGTPSKSEPSYWDGATVPWYTPTDLTRTGWRYAADPQLSITEIGVSKSSARIFPAGSVLMTSRATLGVLAIATTEATTNQGFIVFLPDERWTAGFIYEWLDSKAADLAALGTGATFKEITKGALKRFPFVVPAQPVLDAHRAATEPIEQQIRALEEQTRNLEVLRNLLLPKLVTGQIDVSTLDLDALVEGQVA